MELGSSCKVTLLVAWGWSYQCSASEATICGPTWRYTHNISIWIFHGSRFEQNLCHPRNHWGIEDKTFPWHCFYTADWSDLCISRLFQCPNNVFLSSFLHTLFFSCRNCSWNVSCADTTTGPFKAAWTREVPLWLSSMPGSLSLSSTWVSPLPASMILKPNFRSFGQARRDGYFPSWPLETCKSSMTQWVGFGRSNQSYDSMTVIKIWQENGAAASGPFCQRLLEQLGHLIPRSEYSPRRHTVASLFHIQILLPLHCTWSISGIWGSSKNWVGHRSPAKQTPRVPFSANKVEGLEELPTCTS